MVCGTSVYYYLNIHTNLAHHTCGPKYAFAYGSQKYACAEGGIPVWLSCLCNSGEPSSRRKLLSSTELAFSSTPKGSWSTTDGCLSFAAGIMAPKLMQLVHLQCGCWRSRQREQLSSACLCLLCTAAARNDTDEHTSWDPL